MRFMKPPRELLAVAVLAAAGLMVAPTVPGAQERIDAALALHEQRAEAERARRTRAERHRRLEQQARAHAQMPDTMYASTPDSAPPPHAAHAGALDVSAKLSLLRSDSSASARSEGDVEHGIAYFPSALRWRQLGLQGVARVINRSGEAGEVRIDAWDDAGVHHGPATLAIGAGESVQFNSLHLESGYADRGLSDGVGAGTGGLAAGLKLAP